MSRVGIVLCMLYAFVIGICLVLASGTDPKSHFVFLQLPLVLQMSFLNSLGVKPSHTLSWGMTYLVLGLPTFVILYCFGWLFDGRRAKKPESTTARNDSPRKE